MQLRHLEYFLAVAEELSFTRAAARLHIAQPPLSVQIRGLENELGVDLFDRSRRAIVLTAAGRALVPEARRIIGDVERAARIVRNATDGTAGRLALGFVPTAAGGVLPQILRRYRGLFPSVELTLHERSPDDLLHQLHERRIDAGFLFEPLSDDSVDTYCVNTEHLIAALPADHPLAGQELIDVRELAGAPLILPTRHNTPGLFSRIQAMIDEVGIDPVVVQREIWMMQTIIGLVAAGIGVAIIPSSAALLERDGVVFRPLQQEIEPLEMVVAWPKGSVSPTAQAFLDLVHTETGEIVLGAKTRRASLAMRPRVAVAGQEGHAIRV